MCFCSLVLLPGTPGTTGCLTNTGSNLRPSSTSGERGKTHRRSSLHGHDQVAGEGEPLLGWVGFAEEGRKVYTWKAGTGRLPSCSLELPGAQGEHHSKRPAARDRGEMRMGPSPTLADKWKLNAGHSAPGGGLGPRLPSFASKFPNH